MWIKWFPWRWVVSRLARAYGFLDPLLWLARMRGFAQPSDVAEPVELLRAGVIFHARGLINTRAIQHNLDWIWPYWVERQFKPGDSSFIPRAFSFSHINLTHRNWTAVGIPGLAAYPIVDPRGLVTPLYDGWSLDFWILTPEGRARLFPSKLETAHQRLIPGDPLRVETRLEQGSCLLTTEVSVRWNGAVPCCRIQARLDSPGEAKLAVVVRPYNPEGVSFVDSIQADGTRAHWTINHKDRLSFNRPPEHCHFSTYRQGDVAHELGQDSKSSGTVCPISMATGAAVFSWATTEERQVEVEVLLDRDSASTRDAPPFTPQSWSEITNRCSRLEIPDARLQEIFETAVCTLILLTPGSVYPGPYTYRRFWYRDAAFMLHALLVLGAVPLVRRALDRFPQGQTISGYFRSQDGEWDSNGEVLWIWHRYLQLTGQDLPRDWRSPVENGARWILHKRLPSGGPEPHAGLFPAGFSAEHFGPNDFYYWDDFWGVAGLRAASAMLRTVAPEAAKKLATTAEEFLATIVSSFRFIPERRHAGAIAASPHRRLDAGAIGSLVADYPLQLFAPADPRILATTEYLLAHSSYQGGFFQNMVHSGINAYLTLHLAQVLLRAADPRAGDLIETVARLATPTGQWPEAIHPHTGGGCMGDGQHGWASAEWVLAIRNLFVREEGARLVLGPGLFPRWLERRQPLSFGPTPTPHGPVTLRLLPEPGPARRFQVRVQAEWRAAPPELEVCVPGYEVIETGTESGSYVIERKP